MEDFLIEMYTGQENRDASSKYNGYLFQDLVGVELLLDAQDNAELVMECIEDIVMVDNSSMKIYQVKHYTSKNEVKMGKIKEDFFYQYLRKQLNQDRREVEFKLVYAGKLSLDDKTLKIEVGDNVQLNIDEVKKNFGDFLLGKGDLQKKDAQKKDAQKKYLFEAMATRENVEKFEEKVSKEKDWTIRKESISDYRDELREKIYTYLVQANAFSESDKLKDILLGAAVMYIQKSYTKKAITERSIKRSEFVRYLESLVGIRDYNDQHIVLLILGYIDQLFAQYQDDDGIVELYLNLYKSTKEYFSEFLKEKENRYRLLNTISTVKNEKETFAEYSQLTIENEMNLFRERSSDLESFIRNVWKVMFDMECDKFSLYIEAKEEEFMCYSLPKEKNIIFLASSNGGNQKVSLKNIFQRISGWDIKPKGWYFRSKYVGTRQYTQDITKLISNENQIDVTQIDKGDYFYLKCMDCIQVDDEMGNKDNCTCINKLKCEKGKF